MAAWPPNNKLLIILKESVIMKKKMLLMLLSVAVCVSMIAAATYAWFTDEDSVSDATFTAGTLDIQLDDNKLNEEGVYGEVVIPDQLNMNPGDVYEYVDIFIRNTGTKKLAWFGDWEFTSADGALLDAMYIDYMKMEMFDENGQLWITDEDHPLYNDYKGDEFIVDGVGAGTYAASYNTLVDDSWGVITLRNWDDNALMSGNKDFGFEHLGALLPGNYYKLTVRFGFNKLADNDYQEKSIKIGFKVRATQVREDAINDEIGDQIGTQHINWLLRQIKIQELGNNFEE